MPELSNDMYCSQQISIPPTFPYLLRQYAKAAIRTQPADLLRWSTAYFRCLALNLPPPIKPRLEYPIPKSHFGLTPGWLKALVYQLQNNLTVPFKVLWDRWIGACLQHENLIEILCLSGFTDHNEIPWFRFVALCAGHITENLTQTMIMVCEILTEEPEGGSAMVPLEVFVDVYKFLAQIDASEPQKINNLYFTDSLLSIYREPPAVVSSESTIEVEEKIEEEEVVYEEEKVEEVEEKPVEDLVGVVISCPDIAIGDAKTEDEFLEETVGRESIDYKSPTIPAEVIDLENADLEKERQEKAAIPMEGAESVDTLIGYMPERKDIMEYLEEAKKDEVEEEEGLEEEVDEDLKRLKYILETAPAASEIEMVPSVVSVEEVMSEEGVEEKPPNYAFVNAIPGVGGIVPTELVEAVIEYMKECSVPQHGMVMPRNLRHFKCPPLEVAYI
ncbi:hypothetical protein RI129_012733 [Pyrocoelia pectoralis]|uniref:Ropporin-1-like protein n=1 Tax=Pyrocoelia pectoralis TaxID=417401 RepID=A0AAN7ZGA5_9COLE